MATQVVVLALPFEGRWTTQNSPARRIPSHGTDLLAGRFAIDFVAVDDRGRTAHRRDWRTVLATEPPNRFVGFGLPIRAPVDGTVVAIRDGEPDHAARRSPLALVPYALGQAHRLRGGVAALAGNHVVIQLAGQASCVALAHLRAGSLRVGVGTHVTVGTWLADCGNSGNSTEPHVHVQATDGPDPSVAGALPLAFRQFREWPNGAGEPLVRRMAVPGERCVVEPLTT